MEPLEFSPEWFDESSKAWRANKKRVGQSWAYVCSVDLCKRVCMNKLYSSGKPHCSNSHLYEKQPSPLKNHLVEKQEVEAKRRSLRLASKHASSQETSPLTRTSQRLRKAESQVVLRDQVVSHKAVRKLPVTPSQ